MPWKPGESGNPKGPPVGNKHGNRKYADLVLRILNDRNDTDPLALLSTIVTCAEAPLELRVQAAGMLAPYKHAKCTTRYISKKISLYPMHSVGDALANIERISVFMASKRIGLDEGRDLIASCQAFVDCHAVHNLEQRVIMLEAQAVNGKLESNVRVEGGLPRLPLAPTDGRLILPGDGPDGGGT